MDREIFAHFLMNENEGRFGRPDAANTHYRWDGEGWIGTDYDKFGVKTEGTVRNGKVEDGQHEFLYSRAIATYFDLQAGLRSDLDSRRTRKWAAFGLEGLAPYFFEVGLTGYVKPGRSPRRPRRSVLRPLDHQPADPADRCSGRRSCNGRHGIDRHRPGDRQSRTPTQCRDDGRRHDGRQHADDGPDEPDDGELQPHDGKHDAEDAEHALGATGEQPGKERLTVMQDSAPCPAEPAHGE
jgi:hypothetical protein